MEVIFHFQPDKNEENPNKGWFEPGEYPVKLSVGSFFIFSSKTEEKPKIKNARLKRNQQKWVEGICIREDFLAAVLWLRLFLFPNIYIDVNIFFFRCVLQVPSL